MSVRITEVLKAVLQAKKLDHTKLVGDFEAWKSLGPAGEYQSPVFGKDSAYITPKVDGKQYTLRHVHLPPMSDAAKLSQWNKDWRHRTRKKSNRVLVYADNEKGDYLLIFILDEPSAHDIANMRTQPDKETMEGFAAVAEAFMYDGTVLT